VLKEAKMKTVPLKRLSCILLICSVLFLLMSCISKAPNQTGFLDSYGSLEPDPDAEGVFYYRNPKITVQEITEQYTEFIIDPVVIYFHEDTIGRAVNPDDLKLLTDFVKTELTTALKDGYSIVEVPGPNVIRIRTALTNVLPSKPRMAFHPAATAFSLSNASIEAEFLDSKTNERLVAVMDTRLHKTSVNMQNRTMKEHAMSVIKEWARFLRERLDEAYGK
jgi:hypothetical protein